MFRHPLPPVRLTILLVLVMFCASMLTSCGTAPPQLVEVPVPVPCNPTEPEVPDWATARLQPGATLFEKVRAALEELHQHRGYEIELLAAVKGCK
jgi:hypothetical protein